jgi:mono/diheme cytochrome c family protein
MKKGSSLVRQSWIVVAALFSGVAAAQIGPFSLRDYSGQEIYQRFCSSCHGESGHGDGPVAPTLATVVPDLTELYRRYGNRFPAQELRETIDGRNLVIAHGVRTMPVWGYEFWWEDGADIEAEATARATIDKLLEYLRSIQNAQAQPLNR